jgi:hypothetical protein
MKKIIMPVTVTIISGVLFLIDSSISHFFSAAHSFTWVAFVNWTVFFMASDIERIKAFPSYTIGFLGANAMILLGNMGGGGIAVVAVAVAVISGIIYVMGYVKYLHISSMFLGISLTFALSQYDIAPFSITMVGVILIYGLLGLISGWICVKAQEFVKKDESITK